MTRPAAHLRHGAGPVGDGAAPRTSALLPLLVEGSLWSCDPASFDRDVARLTAGVDTVHIDTGDGQMVPEQMFTPDVLSTWRTRLPSGVHVHLMASVGMRTVPRWAGAGANRITVHVEADDTAEVLRWLREYAPQVTPGIAIARDTPLRAVEPFLGDVGGVLLVGTPLGTRGTDLDDTALTRLRDMRGVLDLHRAQRPVPLIADGGIRADTVAALAEAGATGVVAGSLLLGAPGPITARARWIAAGGRGPIPDPDGPAR